MHFPDSRRAVLGRSVGDVKAVDGITFDIHQRRDAGPGRRERLRQDDGRPRHPAALPADRRRGRISRRRSRAAETPDELRRARRHMQMIFQDPYASLNPQMRVGEIIARPLARPRHGGEQARRRSSAVTELMQKVGLNRVVPRPLPARILRRPAPAHRHRPGARHLARLHRLRRADLRARRLDPGADRQPARAAARGSAAHLPVHRPRPQHGALHLDARRA